MDSIKNKVDMGFTKELFPEGTHMCLIYDDDQQRKKIIGQFLAKGIQRGEQVSYFADTTNLKDVEDWLKDMGVVLPENKKDEKFKLLKAENAYCPYGKFIPAVMLNILGSCYDRAINAGYSGSRVSGEMSWSLKGIPGSEKLMEYEALINTISDKHPVTPICQYDARRFDGATLLNVLKVHPLMIVQGKIVQNPYYISSEEFLKFVSKQEAVVNT
jgi:hypothetical protein